MNIEEGFLRIWLWMKKKTREFLCSTIRRDRNRRSFLIRLFNTRFWRVWCTFGPGRLPRVGGISMGWSKYKVGPMKTNDRRIKSDGWDWVLERRWRFLHFIGEWNPIFCVFFFFFLGKAKLEGSCLVILGCCLKVEIIPRYWHFKSWSSVNDKNYSLNIIINFC